MRSSPPECSPPTLRPTPPRLAATSSAASSGKSSPMITGRGPLKRRRLRRPVGAGPSLDFSRRRFQHPPSGDRTDRLVWASERSAPFGSRASAAKAGAAATARGERDALVLHEPSPGMERASRSTAATSGRRRRPAAGFDVALRLEAVSSGTGVHAGAGRLSRREQADRLDPSSCR